MLPDYRVSIEFTCLVMLLLFQYMPHYDSDHSEYALMIRDRPPTTYFWQRDPTTLKVMAHIRPIELHGEDCPIVFATCMCMYVHCHFIQFDVYTLYTQGGDACCLQRKHLDLLLAYWMGRYQNE